MSRTIKGSKGAGFEYHRIPKGGYYPFTKWFKRYAKKVRRSNERLQLRNEER